MATSGVFQLITNNGKQDKLLMATELLRNRLNDISLEKQPTLKDIEKTHVLFFTTHFKPFVSMSFEYIKVMPNNKASCGKKVKFNIPQYGDLFHDMCLHVKIDSPTITNKDPLITPSFNYCDFIGERLLESVQFEINGNVLDKYDHHAMNFRRLFFVSENIKTSYYRCVGQELPEESYLNQLKGFQNSTPDNYRVKLDVCLGNQTPKETLDTVELFIPLCFWFNLDPRLSIPSIAIPSGQRFIELDLAEQTSLIGYNLRGGSLIPVIADLNFSEFNLYVNNIFLNPEIHNIFLQRIGFTLIRIHKIQKFTANKSEDTILLKDMKFPIESLFIGMKLKSNENSLSNWHHFSKISSTEKDLPNVLAYYENSGNVLNDFADIEKPQITVNQKISTIDTISLTAHGVKIYETMPSGFFNQYTSYRYGGQSLGAPKDDLGAMFIPFCLYPGSYQPSGHINISRAREFYLKYKSSVDSGVNVINRNNNGTLIILASALNFLLIHDGSAVLRYST